MLETIIELAIYIIVGLVALAVAGWDVATGQFFSIDGLLLTFVCLSVAAVFLGAFALGLRSGDFSELLNKLRRPKRDGKGSGETSGTASGSAA